MRPADIISSVPSPSKPPLVHVSLSVISNIQPVHSTYFTVPTIAPLTSTADYLPSAVSLLLNSGYTFCIRGLDQQCDFFNSSTMSLRPCQPCRRSKIRCNREVPHCQACVKRGRSSLCVYEMRVSDQEPALPEPHSKRQKKEHRRASGEYQFEWRAFEPGYERSFRYETSTNEKIQQIEPEKEANINHLHQSHFDRGDMTPHETSPKSITATTADKDWVSRPEYRVAAVDDILERPQRILTYQPTPRYAEMTPPVINCNLRGNLRPQG